MKKSIILILSLIVLLPLVGCSPKHAMRPADMYKAPMLSQEVPTVTLYISVPNKKNYYAEGWTGAIAWNRLLIAPDGEVTETLALALKLPGTCYPAMITVMPKPKSELKGYVTVYASHDGKKVFNARGEEHRLKSPMFKLKREEVEKFSPPITGNESYIMEISTKSPEFKQLLEAYTLYRIKEVGMIKRYAHSKYGSNLPKEDLEKLAKSDSLIMSLWDWATDGWVVPVGFPFLGPEAMAFSAGAYKVFQLPSAVAKKIDLPGYREHFMNAEETAEQTLFILDDYEYCKQLQSR